MSGIAEGFDDAWRDFNVAGVPSSGVYRPRKDTIRSLGAQIENEIQRRFYTPEDEGAIGDGDADDTEAFQRALDSFGEKGGVLYALGRYFITAPLVVPEQVVVRGAFVKPEQRDFGASVGDLGSQIRASFNTGLTPAIQLAGRGAAVEGMVVLRAGLPLPVLNEAGALALEGFFDGTGIQAIATGCTVRDSLLAGWGHALIADLSANEGRIALSNVLADCTNGFTIQGTGDVNQAEALECWPLLTAHVPGVTNPLALQRQGIAFQLTDIGGTQNDWTQIDRCFCYGYSTAYDLFNASNVQMLNCQADYTNPNTNSVRAFHVRGNSQDVRLVSCTSIAHQIGVVIDSTASGVACSVLSPKLANTAKNIDLVRGRAIVDGGVYDSASVANIDIGTAATVVRISQPFLQSSASVGIRVSATFAGTASILLPENQTGVALYSIPDAVRSRVYLLDQRSNQAGRDGAAEVLDFVDSATERAAILAGTSSTDHTAIIRLALAACKAVRLSAGRWNIANLLMDANGQRISGGGRAVTELRVLGAATRGIYCTAGLNNLELSGFKLTRDSTATAGGDGIDWTPTLGNSRMDDLWIVGQYRSLVLGSTDFGILRNSVLTQAVSDQIYMRNNTDTGAMQWSLENVLISRGGARAIAVEAQAGVTQVTLGSWRNVATFANSGKGVSVVGLPAVPVQDVRIYNGFIGEDGDSEIYLDTYGKLHQIADCFVELAGRGATGPLFGTPASGIGCGVEITANNTDVMITGGRFDSHSYEGILSSATDTIVTGADVTDNGRSATAGRRAGIRGAAGRLTVSGCKSGNRGATVSQLYGVYMTNDGGGVVVANDLNGNTTAGFGSAVTMATTKVALNAGSTINILGLPTVNPGAGSGILWNDTGVVKVA